MEPFIPTLSDAVACPTLPSVPTPIPDFEERQRPWPTSSGVIIGGAAQLGRPAFSADAERLQSALLDVRTAFVHSAANDEEPGVRARVAQVLRRFRSKLSTF